MCYFYVIPFELEEAQAVATLKDANSTAVFKSMLQSFPLQGYETDGDEVLNATERYKSLLLRVNSHNSGLYPTFARKFGHYRLESPSA